MHADTRSCTMASMARCLNQTLVQQSQEEAEWFQFCRPAVETKKEGKGKSVIESLKRGPNLRIRLMLTEVSLAAYIYKKARMSMSMSACSSTQNHSTFVTD